MVNLTIPGPPKGKGRPVVMKTGHTFTPKKTVNYETLVQQIFAAKYPGFVPLKGGVRLGIIEYRPIPKSTSKKKRALMLEHKIVPLKKPDQDNVLKIIGDSLNQIAWVDDKQIEMLECPRFYDNCPRVEIFFDEFTDEDGLVYGSVVYD